ncbi:MAG: type sorting protein, partial [Bacteroidota bacterium]|nr:type sorting protein [Bacteroidota bacterium]
MKKVFTLVLLIQISLGCFAQLWNEKSLLPQPHLGEVSFSIDSLGYVYTGDATNNFYCYNPSTNTWAPKANFPGVARAGAAGFAIGSNGYVGSGISTVTNGLYYKDFYQYNPSTDSWTSKAAYPDSTTLCAGFTLGSHGYQWGATRKFYQYDPVTDLWAQKANVPSNFSFATSVLGKGYAVRSNQIWEYDSLLDTWTQRANSNSTIGGKGFTLDNKLYMPNSDSLRIFDPASNSWSGTISFPLAPFTPGPLVDGEFASFAIGGLGYVLETKCTSHFWQLDPSHYFIFNSFSPDTICSGDTVTFYFTTNIHFDSSNYFKFQNAGQVLGAFGNFGSSYNTIDSFPSLGGDTVTFRMTRSLGGNSFGLTRSFAIFSTNPPGQTAYDLQTLTLKAGPTSTLPGSYNFCVGKKVILSYSANSSFHYFWSDSTGLIGTKSSDTVSPAYPVTYYLRVIDTLTGCTQYDTTVAMPHGIPAPGLPDTVYNICPSALLSLGGTAVSGYIYRWTDGNGFNSALASPTVSPTISDTYNLTVTDTTSSSRCSATASVNVTTKQSPAQTLCMVSVDSASSHNIIVWEKLDKTATDSFYLLREMSTNNYVQIAAVPRDSLSEFEDYGADPNVTAYRYKIMVKDT